MRIAWPLLCLLGCSHEPIDAELPADPIACGLGAADGEVVGELELSDGDDWSPGTIAAVWRAHAADTQSYLDLVPDFTVRNFRFRAVFDDPKVRGVVAGWFKSQ